jgi:predicted acylesterase/phospholipase RssA
MSCSVPLYFRAVQHRGDWYVDGGVADNFPVAWAVHAGAAHVFGIRLKPRRGAIKTLDAFIGALVDASTQEYVPRGVDVLDLDAPGVSSLNFGAPRSQLLKLFSAGAKQAELYMKKVQ